MTKRFITSTVEILIEQVSDLELFKRRYKLEHRRHSLELIMSEIEKLYNEELNFQDELNKRAQ
tara:strand:+ start:108 stop:296 length:189 start_codon:yes stop_codon:yes gene_type:complete